MPPHAHVKQLCDIIEIFFIGHPNDGHALALCEIGKEVAENLNGGDSGLRSVRGHSYRRKCAKRRPLDSKRVCCQMVMEKS